MKAYTIKEIRKAGKIGEISSIDVEHLISLLDEAKKRLREKCCLECKHFWTNPFDQWFCRLDYDLENGKNCKFKKYKKITDVN